MFQPRFLVEFLDATLVSPSQARAIWHNARLGLRMGRSTRLLLAAPLEASLPVPLADVRRALGISSADVEAIHPSGTSVLARAMMAGMMANRRE